MKKALVSQSRVPGPDPRFTVHFKKTAVFTVHLVRMGFTVIFEEKPHAERSVGCTGSHMDSVFRFRSKIQ